MVRYDSFAKFMQNSVKEKFVTGSIYARNVSGVLCLWEIQQSYKDLELLLTFWDTL